MYTNAISFVDLTISYFQTKIHAKNIKYTLLFWLQGPLYTTIRHLDHDWRLWSNQCVCSISLTMSLCSNRHVHVYPIFAFVSGCYPIWKGKSFSEILTSITCNNSSFLIPVNKSGWDDPSLIKEASKASTDTLTEKNLHMSQRCLIRCLRHVREAEQSA